MFFVGQNLKVWLKLGKHEAESSLHIRNRVSQSGLIFEQITIESRLVDKCTDHGRFLWLLVEPSQERFERDHLLEDRQKPPAGHKILRALEVQLYILHGEIGQMLVQCALVFEVALSLTLLHFEQGRLGNIDVSALEQFRHLTEEERKQQRADVAA